MSESERIDINTADAATLATITGIGPALAERIIEYRETVHPFEEVIELTAVPGISEKMVRSFEDWVMVQPALQALDEPEDMPLLGAPEEVILLGAPDQPEALLAAELPGSAPEAEEAAVTETSSAEPEPEQRETTPAAEEEEAVTRTAVPPRNSPEIEDLPLAEPMNPSIPEPDLFAVAPPQSAADWDAKARRRGCLNTLLGATFGAILGAVLTLAILAAINNGTINYAYSDTQLQQQLDTEIISRTQELNQLTTRVSEVATEEAATNQALEADFATANEAINESLTENALIIRELEQRLEEVAGAADTFTDFLDGLRLLLDDLEGGTATPTPAPAEETVLPTPTPTPFSTATPLPSATTAVQPTRTPQPTATSFSFPTNTPAPQP